MILMFLVPLFWKMDIETKIFTKDNDFVMENEKIKYFDYDKVKGT